VKVFNPEQHRADVELGVRRAQQAHFPDHVEEVHSLDVLEQEINVVFVLEASVEVHDEREVCHFHRNFLLLTKS